VGVVPLLYFLLRIYYIGVVTTKERIYEMIAIEDIDDYIDLCRMLQGIESQEFKLCRLEGHCSIQGAASIINMNDVFMSMAELVKSAYELDKNPFEPAVIDNLVSARRDFATARQVFITPRYNEDGFDARDIVDTAKLKDCLDIFVRASSVMDENDIRDIGFILFNVITAAYAAIICTNAEDLNLYKRLQNADRIKDCVITFTLLKEQKYYTSDERAAIEESENRRMRAEQEAKERAEIEEEVRRIVADLTGSNTHTMSGTIAPEVVLTGYKCIKKHLFNNFEEMVKNGSIKNLKGRGYIAQGSTTVKELKCALAVINTLFNTDYDIKSDDLGVSILSGDVRDDAELHDAPIWIV